MNRFLILLLATLPLYCAASFESGLEKFQHKEKIKVGVLSFPKSRPIDESSFVYVKLAIDHYIDMGADIIFLDLDTPGGELSPTMSIVELLNTTSKETGIITCSFIDTWAISAGALLAYGTDIIVSSNKGIMGAAAPVIAKNEGGQEMASEKFISAVRAEYGATAHSNGRNQLIAEAMVDKDLYVVSRDGAIISIPLKEEAEKGDIVISERGKLLTLNADLLVQYNIAEKIVDGSIKSALRSIFHIEESNIELLNYSDWKVSFLSFLSHPLVLSSLYTLLMVCGYIEYSTPGFGFFGGIASLALLGLFLTKTMLYTFPFMEILFMVIGLVFLFVEMFVIPGFGIIGISGILLFIAGSFLLILPKSLSMGVLTLSVPPLHIDSLEHRFTLFVFSLFVTVVTLWYLSSFIIKHSNRVPIVETNYQKKYIIENTLEVGATGVSISPLRPCGNIRIQNKKYDAISCNKFIRAGANIRVVKTEGQSIFVEEY